MAKDPPTSMPRSFVLQDKPNADGWNQPLLQAMSFHSCGPAEALRLGKVFQDNWDQPSGAVYPLGMWML